jgi:hypothetical protein
VSKQLARTVVENGSEGAWVQSILCAKGQRSSLQHAG